MKNALLLLSLVSLAGLVAGTAFASQSREKAASTSELRVDINEATPPGSVIPE